MKINFNQQELILLGISEARRFVFLKSKSFDIWNYFYVLDSKVFLILRPVAATFNYDYERLVKTFILKQCQTKSRKEQLNISHLILLISLSDNSFENTQWKSFDFAFFRSSILKQENIEMETSYNLLIT